MTFRHLDLKVDPFKTQRSDGGRIRGEWPARWIGHPHQTPGPFLAAYRLSITCTTPSTLRLHLSADERYTLYVNGYRICRGPERSETWSWFFESIEVGLDPGVHLLVAVVWSMAQAAPGAQISINPGFICASDDPVWSRLVNTGTAPWETKQIDGVRFVEPGFYSTAGWGTEIDGSIYPWDCIKGTGNSWVSPVFRAPGRSAGSTGEWGEAGREHFLRPAMLKPQMDKEFRGARARFISAPPSLSVASAVHPADDLFSEHAAWTDLFTGRAPVRIGPRSCRRVIAELDTYLCAYDRLRVSGGAGSMVRICWTESLYEEAACENQTPKGRRDVIENKFVRGVSNIYRPDGSSSRTFFPLWWRAGRYLEICVTTTDEELIIEDLCFDETRYPLESQAIFDAADLRLGKLVPLCLRTMQECTHETFVDSPYYEQLHYALEARILSLISYTITNDYRHPRKSIEFFAGSRLPDGMTQSCYPSGSIQRIPPLSLLWCSQVYEHALWRGNSAFIRRMMPAVRGVLEAFWACRRPNGLIDYPPGWNFIDHTGKPGWRMGLPPVATDNTSADVNWQFALTARQVAELELWIGEKEFVARAMRMAHETAGAAMGAFWQEERGLFSNDLGGVHFSEHPQCFALLSGLLEPTIARRLTHSLLTAPDLVRSTLYFKHFLFEALQKAGRAEALFDRLDEWYDALDWGFKTLRENPEPSRGDCQGWGPHPLYHFFATILGIRPATMGFASVSIAPQLGPLAWARGSMVHPRGMIVVDVKRSAGGTIEGEIGLPDGLMGTFTVDGRATELRPGTQSVK